MPTTVTQSVPERALPSDPMPGVNLVGYLRGELGVGEVARKLARALERAGIPFAEIDYAGTASRREHRHESRRPSEALYDTNVVCLNPRDLRRFVGDHGPDLFTRRYTVGVWFWETTRFPDSDRWAFHFVDEIWVASTFVRDVVAAATWKPVFVIPLPLDVLPPPTLSRAELGLPEGFLFLFVFDFQSVFERKNPLALVEAFRTAFRPGEGATLVIKTINGHRKPRLLERLQAAAADRPDIHVVDGYVAATTRDALIAVCDCYVSLHRSEGLGLTMAEAMAYGKPVIATAFSGNTEFMHADNSYPVPYVLVEIPPGEAYPAGALWAEPDTSTAAALMRSVFDDRDRAAARGARARRDITGTFSLARSAEALEQRFVDIHARPLPSADPVSATLRLALMRLSLASEEMEPGRLLAAAARGSARGLLRKVILRALWPYLAARQRFDADLLDTLSSVQRAYDAAAVVRAGGFARQSITSVAERAAAHDSTRCD